MKVYLHPDREAWPKLLKRTSLDAVALEEKVNAILADVQSRGEAAVRDYAKKFDGVAVEALLVTATEIKAAAQLLDDNLKSAIAQAAANIRRFHEAQLKPEPVIETMPGVRCWRKNVGIEKVGLYIPGGSAPLFSTLLMLAIPATIAGCKSIVLCTPPAKDGSIHPAILFAAQTAGVTQIFKAGGVQAIAAMAYGTETIPAVYKIFGPGNQYVTCAKQLVQRKGLAIDMPAGPSEVAVFADASANADFIAADLLSQAEHGPDSQVILVTTEETLVQKVQQSISAQLEQLPRRALAEQSLANSKAIVVKDEATALELLNEYAAEHLILACTHAESMAASVVNAGSVFLGHYSPESAGDYASGTNHTLPTNGYARAYSGVSVDSFVKKITYQELSEQGLRNIGPTVEAMAAAEGLEAHKQAVSIRLRSL
ncbi:MAG: histidinol dehydrogenase [Bacteroidota bacterium]|nr:histidinol dehydrogenase [Bacteroidota bacterium]